MKNTQRFATWDWLHSECIPLIVAQIQLSGAGLNYWFVHTLG